MDKAKEHEALMEILDKCSRPSRTFQTSAPSKEAPKPVTQPNKWPEIKRISPQEMAKRREKRLYYNCDEVYTRGHKCVKPQLYLMVGDEEASDNEIELNWQDEHEADISIHAL